MQTGAYLESVINYALGPAAAVVASILFYFSYVLTIQKKRQFVGLAFLVFGGFSLRLAASIFFNIHTWDERYHALVATHLLDNPLKPVLLPDPIRPYDVDNWHQNHVWLHKPPVTMWLMAMSLFVFGRVEWAIRLPSVILGSISPVILFCLAKKSLEREGDFFRWTSEYSARIAWLASFFYSINGLLIELESGRAATDHTDALMTFFVLLSVWLGTFSSAGPVRGYFGAVLSGLSIGVSILTKWWAGLIALPVILFWNISQQGWAKASRRIGLTSLSLFLIVVPWEVYTRLHFPLEVAAITKEHLSHFSDSLGHPGSVLFHFFQMVRIYGSLIYLPLGAAILALVTAYRARHSSWFVLAAWLGWVAGPYLVFSAAAAKMSGLVMISSAPIFYFLSRYWWWLRQTSFSGTFAKVLKGVVLVVLVAAPIQFCLERTKVFRAVERFPDMGKELKSLANRVGPDRKAVVFGMPRPLEAMFYAPITMYHDHPTAEEIDLLSSRGYRVYFFEGRGFPAGLDPRVQRLPRLYSTQWM